MNFPDIQRAFLSQEECQTVIEVIERYASGEQGLRPSRKTESRLEIAARFLFVQGLIAEAAFLGSIRQRCSDYVNSTFQSDQRLYPVYPEFMLLQANYAGDSHSRHADNARFDSAEGKWMPNHTPQRAVSSCLYLNRCGEDFHGGELVFPEMEIRIPPESGTFVVFPSDERFEHEVNPISSGTRYSLLLWFTKERNLCERPFVPNHSGQIAAFA